MSARHTGSVTGPMLLCLLLIFARPASAGGPRSTGHIVGFVLLFGAVLVVNAVLLRYIALPSKERALVYRARFGTTATRWFKLAAIAFVVWFLALAVFCFLKGYAAPGWASLAVSPFPAVAFAWEAHRLPSRAHDDCAKLQEEANKTKHERTDSHRRALVIQNREQYLAARDDAHGRMQRFAQDAALHEFLKSFPDRYNFEEILACESEPWTLYLLAAEAQKTDVLATEQKQTASEIQDLFSQIERDATTIAAFTTGFEQLKVKLSLEIQDPNARAQAISLLESNKRALFRKKGWF